MDGGRLLREIDTELGPVRDDDLAVHDARSPEDHVVDPRRLGDEVLLDQEVRDDGVELHRGGRPDEPRGIVGRDLNVARLRHGDDLLHLGQPASMTEVGLDHVDGVEPQDLLECELGAEPLPGGDGDPMARATLVPMCINVATYVLGLIRALQLPSHLRRMRGYAKTKPIRHRALAARTGGVGESREEVYVAIL